MWKERNGTFCSLLSTPTPNKTPPLPLQKSKTNPNTLNNVPGFDFDSIHCSVSFELHVNMSAGLVINWSICLCSWLYVYSCLSRLFWCTTNYSEGQFFVDPFQHAAATWPPLTLAFSVLLQMNCWQRRRGTRTSVMSWIRPSLSWQDTEVPSFLSHLHTSSPLTPLLFICKTHCKFVYQTNKQKASTNLHYCLFILECVYEAINWPKRQRRYMNSNFFLLLIPVICLYKERSV